MLFVILVLLLIALMIITRKIDNNYANPYFVSVAVFLVGCFVALANLRRWGFILENKVFFVILFFMVAFGLGCMFPLKTRLGNRKFVLSKKEMSPPSIAVATSFRVLVFLILQCICLGVYVFYYYKSFGFRMSALALVRDYMLEADYPGYIGHIYIISRTIAMVFCYQFIYFFVNKIRQYRLLLPVIPYLMLEIATTGRSGFVYFFGYILVIYCMLSAQLVGKSRRLSKAVRDKILKIGIAVVSIFIILGNITGKTQYMGVYDMLSIYIGAPICNIQYYFDNQAMFISPRFGAYTQPFLSSVFNAIGYKKYSGDLYYPFVKYADTLGRTNIYSTVVKPIIDYGVWGAVFFIFICGLIIGYLYKNAKDKSCSSRRMIVFGYFMMPLFCFGLEYQIGNFWFATRTIYALFYIVVVDYFVNRTYSKMEEYE